MKITRFALFLAALFTAPAALAIPAEAGDLILGFKATSAMGIDTNLEVNLGPASAFYNAGAGATGILTKLAVADLVQTYGNDWATRGDLLWGIAGTSGPAPLLDGTPARTLWATRAEDTPGTSSVPWPRGTLSALANPSNAISAMYTGSPGSLTNFTATANSAFSVKVPAATSGSWKAQDEIVPGVSFRYFNPTVMKVVNTFPAAGSAYDGTAYTTVDLWEVRTVPSAQTGTPGTLLGAIGLNSAGKLVFSKDITKFAPPSVGVELGAPALVLSSGTATVTLTGAPAGNYILERSATLVTPASWSQVGNSQAPAAGNLSFSDPAPPAGRAFYRIRKTP